MEDKFAITKAFVFKCMDFELATGFRELLCCRLCCKGHYLALQGEETTQRWVFQSLTCTGLLQKLGVQYEHKPRSRQSMEPSLVGVLTQSLIQPFPEPAGLWSPFHQESPLADSLQGGGFARSNA